MIRGPRRRRRRAAAPPRGPWRGCPLMYRLYVYIYMYIVKCVLRTLCINDGVADSLQRSCHAS